MQYSIVNFKKLEEGVSFRFDAEFFHPRALLFEKRINGLHGKTIEEYGCTVVSGPFGSSLTSDAYLKSGIPFVRISDLRDFIIDTNELTYISPENHVRLSSSKLNVGDFVLSKVGNTIGIVSIVTPDIGECNISENNLGIRFPKECAIEDRKFILAFLNSEVGQIQILRAISGNAQPKLNVSDAELIRVPIVTPKLIKTISDIIDQAIILIGRSKQYYTQAEQTLLSELGLVNWKPKHRLSFVKNFSDTQASDRIDAEYFQPMYDGILEAVKKYRYGFEPVGTLFKQNRSSFKNKPDELYRYVEISSVNVLSGEIDSLSLIGKELPANAKIKLNNGDLIISKVRTYRGAVAIVQDGGLIGSGAFTVLKESERMNIETAYVYFKSAPILRLSLKYNAGTSYPVIDDKDILNLPFPLMPEETQKTIKQRVVEMYDAKALSKRLFDIAKRGVEMAIEKSEKDAQNWIDAELKKLSVKL